MPDWSREVEDPGLGPDASDDERMAWVLDILDHQVAELTGGPFAAAVFDGVTGEVLSIGVNRVVPTNSCIAHAEMVALAAAGAAAGSFTLVEQRAVLVSSTEPCAMCMGAVVWSGIERLVCGAHDHDARAIGFDEGDKPPDWSDRLERRGITVVTGVLRSRAVAAMDRYAASGAPIYNADGD